MVQVELRDGESLDSAIRRLKRQVMNAGILQEARRHERYMKPSEQRRERAERAKRDARKKERKESE
jgi:small subunit ribosomal protein S21